MLPRITDPYGVRHVILKPARFQVVQRFVSWELDTWMLSNGSTEQHFLPTSCRFCLSVRRQIDVTSTNQPPLTVPNVILTSSQVWSSPWSKPPAMFDKRLVSSDDTLRGQLSAIRNNLQACRSGIKPHGLSLRATQNLQRDTRSVQIRDLPPKDLLVRT